jgi:ferric-dicitrate binding protein FerR (iron transport regulator)
MFQIPSPLCYGASRDWSAVPGDVSPSVRAVLRRCLERDHRRRFADIAAAQALIEEGASLAAATRPARDKPSTSARRRILLTNAATAAAVALIGVGATWFLPRAAPPLVFRSSIITAGPTALSVAGNDRDLVITPDGSRIIYRGTDRLLVRAVDQLEPNVLSGLGMPRGVLSRQTGHGLAFSMGPPF